MNMERVQGPTTAELLQEKVSILRRYDEQIRNAERAKAMRPEVLKEIERLCLKLMQENEIQRLCSELMEEGAAQ